MPSQLLSLLLFLTLLLTLIIISELLHRYWKFPAEQSRKFLHVTGGLMCLLFPTFFQSHWWMLALTGVSFLLLLTTYLIKLLPSVHQTKRKTIGSVLFPIPVYCCFFIAKQQHNDLLYYIPISLLTISDTAAEIAGTKWGHHTKSFFNKQKTLAGAIAFATTAVIVCFTWLTIFHYPLTTALYTCVLIALLTAITESLTLYGWDNLTVPAVAIGILLFILKWHRIP